MTFRKHLGRCLILLMLLAQLALAQHATVHFLEDQYTASAQSDHGHPHPDKHDKSKACQICLSVKELGNLLTPVGAAVLVLSLISLFILSLRHCNPIRIPAASYAYRAPPSFLC